MSIRMLATRRRVTKVGVSGGILALLLTGALTGSAGAAEDPQFCTMVYGGSASAGEKSPLLYEHCSTSAAAEKESLESSKVSSAKADNLLMTWYDDPKYDPGKGYVKVYGNAGTCDKSGYRVEPSDSWKTSISSIAGVGQCTQATLTDRKLTHTENQKLPNSYVGDKLNDNIGIVQVFHG